VAASAAQQDGGAPAGGQVSVAPVEIKTGRAHDSHRAQVLLYLLLMEERYGTALDWGMLWYTGQPGERRAGGAGQPAC
jgi:CRISPR/Cas system-associated exonuclease Cas4 (RecB family)